MCFVFQWFQDQIDAMVREQERIIAEMKMDRERFDSERLELTETHQREIRNLRQTIDMLQKELGDKQVQLQWLPKSTLMYNYFLEKANLIAERVSEFVYWYINTSALKMLTD